MFFFTLPDLLRPAVVFPQDLTPGVRFLIMGLITNEGECSMQRFIILTLIMLLSLPLLPFPAAAGSAEEVKEAVKLKIQGNLTAAIEKFEAAIAADRSAIAEDDGGLMKDLIDHYEKLAAGNDPDILFKLADYLDMYGDTDRAVEFYQKVAASGGAQAEEAKYRAGSLKKEEQLYEQSVQEIISSQAPEPAPADSTTGPAGDGDGNQAQAPAEEPDEAAAMEAERQQKRSELESKIANMEKEVADAEDAMKESKRDREGRGNVRSHRLKESDAGKDKYNNSFGRRYRADKAAYEEKKAQLDKLKEELNNLQ